VEPTATAKEIEAAYRRLTQMSEGGAGLPVWLVRDAYEVLSDPARRWAYDESLTPQGEPSGTGSEHSSPKLDTEGSFKERRRLRVTIMAVVGVVATLIVVVVALGSGQRRGASSGGVASTPGGGSTEVPTTDTSRVGSAIGSRPGLILAACHWSEDGSMQMQLVQLDPGSGAVISRRTLNLPVDRSMQNGCKRGGDGLDRSAFRFRQQFNSDFTRMAVTMDRDDGSSHVGFIDVESGSFTDLDPAPPSPSEFAASPPIENDYPIFHPETGDLWYYSDNDGHVHSVDLDTKATANHGKPLAPPVLALAQSPRFAVAPRSGWLFLAELGSAGGELIPNPSGSAVAMQRGANPQLLAVWQRNGARHDVEPSQSCTPQSWVDDYRLLCVDELADPFGEGGRIFLVSFNDSYTLATFADLVPRNKRANGFAFPSPDQRDFVFISSGSLYRQPLSPGAGEPQKVTDLSALTDDPEVNDWVLLDWRP
jgi:hypothetical protein